jgi:hypothetical protein
MKYDRTIIAYHGCDRSIADRLLAGEPFKPSKNDYDWLGEGIYFWEYGADRAMRFARIQVRRGKVREPATVGALIQLGECFDLMDTKFTSELPDGLAMLKQVHDAIGLPLPINEGTTTELLLRRRDCAVMNLLMRLNDDLGLAYDTVRCGFVEGPPAYEGSAIAYQSHVQIAVRNPACIVGVFRPTIWA